MRGCIIILPFSANSTLSRTYVFNLIHRVHVLSRQPTQLLHRPEVSFTSYINTPFSISIPESSSRVMFLLLQQEQIEQDSSHLQQSLQAQHNAQQKRLNRVPSAPVVVVESSSSSSSSKSLFPSSDPKFEHV